MSLGPGARLGPYEIIAAIVLGQPATLFTFAANATWVSYNVSADGRFLAVVRKPLGTDQPLTVVVNALR